MFEINGITWDIKFVDILSPFLARSDGSQSLAVCDGNKCTIYVSNRLRRAKLRKVLAHELCHCFCFSFNIHMPMEQEEYLADWVSLYGTDLIYLLDDLMGSLNRKYA